MRILYGASEAVPFIKTGGLADVAGSLPLAIRKAGHDIRVVVPNYSSILQKYKEEMVLIAEYTLDLGWRKQYVGVLELEWKGIYYYFIDNEYYFNRSQIYGEYDDGERFAFFSKVVAMLPKIIEFEPEIIHTNDWHTALVNVYIRELAKKDPFYGNIKTLFTIHNLKYQGVFDATILTDILGLSEDYYHEDGLKFFDAINYMKGGIVYCDALNTVSETYAQEIQYKFFGEQLEGVVRKVRHKLTGIINGIDYDSYNPMTDEFIPENYNFNSIHGKGINKETIQRRYDLKGCKDIPLIAMVSRLVPMKGIDLIKHVLDEILQEDLQMVVLGTGEKEYEEMLRHYQGRYPEKLAARLYFSEEEARLIYAGADILLMPSMIEPCGISQLIALRYGTLPIVRETGGLKDTIIPYNRYTGEGNGFSFQNYNAHELLFTLKSALEIYRGEKDIWKGIIKSGMESKNDWNQSSHGYIELYERLIK